MPSTIAPAADAAAFTIGPESDDDHEVTVVLALDGATVGAGIIVPVYLSESPDGLRRAALGNIDFDPPASVYPDHFQTDEDGSFTVHAAVEADEAATLHLVVVLPTGALAVSGPLEFAA